MIEISKEQVDYLLKNGCQWHSDIAKTNSRHPKYFACETNRVKKLIGQENKEVGANGRT